MTRKPIPDSVQCSILLKSRRRCCLCFWLEAIDEVQKGQIAHVDQNNENSDEENLVFLCLPHHDDYDSETRLSKGLRPEEVRKYRDELYRELEHRYRTLRKRSVELSVVGTFLTGVEDYVSFIFQLKNTGEAEIRQPAVSIRLRDGVIGTVPQPKYRRIEGITSPVLPDFFGMTERRADLFESNGRIGVIQPLRGPNPILHTGHSLTFDGLGLRLPKSSMGTECELEYRIDAIDLIPSVGSLSFKLPSTPDEFVRK